MKNPERLVLAALWLVRFVLPVACVYLISLHIVAPMVSWLPPLSTLLVLTSVSYVANGCAIYFNMCMATSGPRIFLLNPGDGDIAEVSLWVLFWPILLPLCFVKRYLEQRGYQEKFGKPANDR